MVPYVGQEISKGSLRHLAVIGKVRMFSEVTEVIFLKSEDKETLQIDNKTQILKNEQKTSSGSSQRCHMNGQ